MILPEQLTTTRLLLRRQRDDDAESIAALLDNWNIIRWISSGIPHPYGLDDARHWISRARRNWMEGRDHQFVVALRQGDTLIGHCGLRPDGKGGADFGYWYGELYWGNGYATEAGRAVVDYGFETLGLDRVWAHVHPDNTRSLRVLQATGLKQTDVRPIKFPALGETVECLHFCLERADMKTSGTAS